MELLPQTHVQQLRETSTKQKLGEMRNDDTTHPPHNYEHEKHERGRNRSKRKARTNIAFVVHLATPSGRRATSLGPSLRPPSVYARPKSAVPTKSSSFKQTPIGPLKVRLGIIVGNWESVRVCWRRPCNHCLASALVEAQRCRETREWLHIPTTI